MCLGKFLPCLLDKPALSEKEDWEKTGDRSWEGKGIRQEEREK